MLKEKMKKTILLPQILTIQLDQIDTGSPISSSDIELILSNLRQKNLFITFSLSSCF